MVTTSIVFLTLLATPSTGPRDSDPHATFDRILSSVVRDERVDYRLLGTEHRSALRAYLDALALIDPATLDRSARTAFLINLYNASMLEAVLERGPDRFRPSDDEFKVFKEPLVRLKTGRVTLDHLEHELLRKALREPRLHVALVCGARSCPPLLSKAYRGETLEATLEANMTRFVRDAARNPIDHEGRRLRISKLFEWFREDFGGDEAQLRTYVGRYLQRDVSGYRLEFVDYDWSLNAAPTSPPAPR